MSNTDMPSVSPISCGEFTCIYFSVFFVFGQKNDFILVRQEMKSETKFNYKVMQKCSAWKYMQNRDAQLNIFYPVIHLYAQICAHSSFLAKQLFIQ